MSGLVLSRLNLGQASQLTSSLLAVNIAKTSSADLNTNPKIDSSQANLPSFCDLVNSKPVVVNSSNPFYQPLPDPMACNSKTISTVVSW